MQQQTAEEKGVRETIPVPPHIRRRLWYGVIGSGLFMMIAGIEGARRPDYDAWHQAISALSLGSGGSVQLFNFLLFGTIILSTVTVWHKMLAGGRGAMAFSILTALTGASLIVCGLVPQDPAPGYDPEGLALKAPTLRGLMHLLFAGIAALSSVVGLLVMAWRFAGDPLWYGWAVYSVLMAVAMVACVTVYAIWSTSSTGYAGTFERLALIVMPIWALTFLVRLETGVAFMRRYS
ncbi:DUF998 domain-containing protein [Pseudoflavitalea sp. X16]|uniref:DUF998 domain-containing protein n=1 Tax=Paraflavitalea devenefica TaxID=2716334 RepID=UPI001423B9E5|nr:DUF998 domain-containing protein [Paraflavitalea devenefica]NII27432.1 DUF998 domain-containing protein [Paraflavitalea devenefica]